MNTLNNDRRAQIVRCLVEGNSIRSTVRMTGASKNTIVKLLVELGQACSEYQDKTLRNLPCRRVQADEIWSFIGAKEKNATPEKKATLGYGDIWTWTAICADTKLMLSWYVGQRTAESAHVFMKDVESRLANRVQLTTDGNTMYLNAIENAFGADIDYAMLVKHYGNEPDGEKRYSPAVCTSATKEPKCGRPIKQDISTSYVERANLSIRMGNRRFTRLTNAFSKKVENHAHAVALQFMYMNFARPHMTLSKKTYPTTPAMAAGIADHVWTIEEIVNLLNSN